MSNSPKTDAKEVANLPTPGDYYDLLRFTRAMEEEMGRKEKGIVHMSTLLEKLKGDLDQAWGSYGALVKAYATDMHDGLINHCSIADIGEPQDCPQCDNSGRLMPDGDQCEWCYREPNSKFNRQNGN